MTFKEILKEWWKGVKAFSTAGWKAIRDLFSTSLHLIKEPIVSFLKALWAWVKAIVIGLYGIIKSFLIDLVTSTLKMIKNVVVCFFNLVDSKIKKKEEKVKKKKK